MSGQQREFVLTLSSKLDLDEKQTFELADLYFARNPSLYRDLLSRQAAVQVLTVPTQPTLVGAQDMRTVKLQECTEELKVFLRSLTIPMTELYYEERVAILKAAVALGTAATVPGHPLQEHAASCVNALIQTKNYEATLWNIYFDYKNKAVASQKLPLEERERFFQQLMKEEFHTLQFFFVLYYQLKSMSTATYVKMLSHFNSTQFQGGVSWYYKDSSEPHIAMFAQEINTLIREIIDLSVLLAMEGLRLDASRRLGGT